MQYAYKGGRATLITCALGTFMGSFDINAVNVALPLMQSGFHTTIAVVEWVVVAYLLALCTTQLTFGRVADLYGAKKVYVTGFIGFTISSLLCGLSVNIVMLIVFRILEAMSAAMLMSSGGAIITNAVNPTSRGKALSLSAVAVALASCAGPSLGGLMTTCFGWSSIFFVNLPIGVIGTFLAVHNIRKDTPNSDKKFDPMGSVLIIAALALILLPIDEISKAAVNTTLIAVSLAVGIILLVLFLVHESRSDHPILSLGLFKNRIFAASNFAATFFYMAEFILMFLLPYYLQQQHGMSASLAGLVMLPMSVALIITAPISGAISDKFDSRIVCGVGMGIMAADILVFGAFGTVTPMLILLIAFAVFGIGGGLFNTPNNSAVLGNVPAQSRGIASATIGTMRNIGMVLGEAVSAAVLSSNINSATVRLSAKGLQGTSLQQGAFAYAMQITCIVAACCAAVALILSLVRGKAKKANGGKNDPANGAAPEKVCPPDAEQQA